MSYLDTPAYREAYEQAGTFELEGDALGHYAAEFAWRMEKAGAPDSAPLMAAYFVQGWLDGLQALEEARAVGNI